MLGAVTLRTPFGKQSLETKLNPMKLQNSRSSKQEFVVGFAIQLLLIRVAGIILKDNISVTDKATLACP